LSQSSTGPPPTRGKIAEFSFHVRPFTVPAPEKIESDGNRRFVVGLGSLNCCGEQSVCPASHAGDMICYQLSAPFLAVRARNAAAFLFD
jgi:hypothetical protein